MKPTNKAIVEDNPNLIRDMSSTAIINTSKDEYNRRIEQKKKAVRDRDEMKSLKNEVAELKKLIHMLIEVNDDK